MAFNGQVLRKSCVELFSISLREDPYFLQVSLEWSQRYTPFLLARQYHSYPDAESDCENPNLCLVIYVGFVSPTAIIVGRLDPLIKCP